MKERTSFDAVLIETRQEIADLSLILAAIDHLRSRADRLFPPLLNELLALRSLIDRAISLLAGKKRG